MLLFLAKHRNALRIAGIVAALVGLGLVARAMGWV